MNRKIFEFWFQNVFLKLFVLVIFSLYIAVLVVVRSY